MQVTYEVSMECEVDGDVLRSLEYVQEHYPNRVDAYIAEADDEASDAYEWIVDNCHETNCVSWDVEIQDLDVEEQL